MSLPRLGSFLPSRRNRSFLGQDQKINVRRPQASIWGLNFPGNASVNIGTDLSLDISGEMTIWVRANVDDLSAISGLFGKMGGIGDRGYSLGIGTNGEIRGVSYISNLVRLTQSANGEIVPGIEYDLAYARRSGLQHIYKNGVVIKTTNFTGLFDTSVQAGKIGESFDTLCMDGLIAEVAIWNKFLSTINMKNLSEKILQPDDLPNLVSWWKIQEGFGSANGTRIEDSQQQNHGSMQGFSGDPWVNIGVR
ncbi:MAG: LamG-like jellyroll fold domain-containing protein [Methylococcaceae bacterium]